MKKLVILLLSAFLCHTVIAQTDIYKARNDSLIKSAISLKTISFKFPAYEQMILAVPGDEEDDKIDISIGYYEANFDFNSDNQIIVTFNKYKDNKLVKTISRFDFPLDETYIDVRDIGHYNFSLVKTNSYSIYIRNVAHKEGYCILHNGGLISEEFNQKTSEDVIKRKNLDSTAFENSTSFNSKFINLLLKTVNYVKSIKKE